MVIINGEKISKSYKSGEQDVEIIKGINIKINKGEFITIVGPSGSGKSTLLYLLSGMEPLSRGSVMFDNNNISLMDDDKLSEVRRDSMAFIFQFYNLMSGMSVMDNVMLTSLIDQGSMDVSRGKEVLKLVGLEGYEKHFPYQLSGGQQQRVAIARALFSKPEIIFADEPTGNLDSTTGDSIMALLKKINDELNTTIVMVTHSDEYAEIGSRKIKMKDGQIC